MLALYMSFIDDESHRRLFEKIYIEYRGPMFFMARSVLGNDSDAEDIVHDVFLKIAKKKPTIIVFVFLRVVLEAITSQINTVLPNCPMGLLK